VSWIAAVLALVVLVALGDVAAAHLGVRRAARTLSDRLRTEADVAVRSWPATPRLLLGRGLAVSIAAADVPLPDAAITLAEVRVDLRGVRPARDDETGVDRLHTDGGCFTARLDTAAVLAATPVPIVRDVEIRPEGLRYHLPGGVSVDGRVYVDEDGDLVFIPASGPIGGFQIVRIAAPIGRLPLGAHIEEVRTELDAIVAAGSVGTSTIPLG
jgi:hypothetical protein